MTRNQLLYGLLFLLAIIIGPIIFTQDWSSIDFSNTGEIGDTIGGITAPIIGFVSAVLVYLAFDAQVKANNRIQDQIELEQRRRREDIVLREVEESIRNLKDDIKEFSYPTKQTSVMITGVQGIHQFLEICSRNFEENYNHGEVFLSPYHIHLDSLLESSINIYFKIENSDFQDELKDYLQKLWYGLVSSNIITPFRKPMRKIKEGENKSNNMCPVCDSFHLYIPGIFFFKINFINDKYLELKKKFEYI